MSQEKEIRDAISSAFHIAEHLGACLDLGNISRAEYRQAMQATEQELQGKVSRPCACDNANAAYRRDFFGSASAVSDESGEAQSEPSKEDEWVGVSLGAEGEKAFLEVFYTLCSCLGDSNVKIDTDLGYIKVKASSLPGQSKLLQRTTSE